MPDGDVVILSDSDCGPWPGPAMGPLVRLPAHPAPSAPVLFWAAEPVRPLPSPVAPPQRTKRRGAVRTLAERILDAVTAEPGCTAREVTDEVGVELSVVSELLSDLVRRGHVVRQQTDGRSAYRVARAG